MASIYDNYWSSIINKIQKGIFEAFSRNETIFITVDDLKKIGNRKSWNGYVKLTRNEILGGEMAHAMSLAKMLKKYAIFKDMPDLMVSFKITNKLILEIETNQLQSLEVAVTKSMLNSRSVNISDSTSEKNTIEDAINELYQLIQNLPVYDHLYKSKELPENGIYLFFERGEQCRVNGKKVDRIVRVGTHDANNRFTGRISNHFRGNKNNSVFRTHLGSALINREKLQNTHMSEWMKHMSPTSHDVEQYVSKTLRDNFKFCCIPVESKEERLTLEKSLISLLSHVNFHPSKNWLGYFAHIADVRESGLWNVRHTKDREILKSHNLQALIKNLRSKIRRDKQTMNLHIVKPSDNAVRKVLCFIPCCSSKDATGETLEPIKIISATDIPKTWDFLVKGRSNLQNYVDHLSQKTTAINLYTGSPYNVFLPHKKALIEALHQRKFRLIVISAGYGIIDALEPIHNYDAMLKGSLAMEWQRNNLAKIISELILIEKPSHVIGFFAGEPKWSTSNSLYRYFFTEGVKIALQNGLKSQMTGCFYRKDGRGVKAILGSLGRTFIDHLNSDFSDDFINDIFTNNRQDGNVIIGFDKISI